MMKSFSPNRLELFEVGAGQSGKMGLSRETKLIRLNIFFIRPSTLSPFEVSVASRKAFVYLAHNRQSRGLSNNRNLITDQTSPNLNQFCL